MAGFKQYMGQAILVISALVIFSCKQGAVSEDPPIHLNPNMDSQQRYDAMAESDFFVDGMVNRMPVEGTVARSEGYENLEYFFGMNADSVFVKNAPVSFNETSLRRGQERYGIYCAPCHSRVGDGKGIIINRGFVPPPTFHDDKYRAYPDGQIFDIISNGFRNMPSYKHQIPVADRWAIVGYVRVLQRSQNARAEDVPPAIRATLTQGE